jgi:uncharacterized cofD-like protein
VIDNSDLTHLKEIKFSPRARGNKEALIAIKEADKIIINPGNFFCSIIPNLLVDGMAEAIKKSKAKKIYICNLMTKEKHTDHYTIQNFVNYLEKYLGENVFDYVIYNRERPNSVLMKKYVREGEYFIERGKINKNSETKYLGFNLLSHKIKKPLKGDLLQRTLIRHDSNKVAKIIFNL